MDFVAHPRGGGLARLVGFRSRGGADARRCRRHVVSLAPGHWGAVPPIIWHPDPALDGDGGHLAPPYRGLRVIDGREPSPASGPHGQREGGPGGRGCGPPVILGPPRVAVPPGGVTHRAPPLRGSDGERSQGVTMLDFVHNIRSAQGRRDRGRSLRLWSWSPVTAWRHVKAVMQAAGIRGVQASPKGLRHGFGVAAVQAHIPLNLVQRWLGDAQLSTTAIYAEAIGPEEQEIAARMWT
jgi:hypothetical protein